MNYVDLLLKKHSTQLKIFSKRKDYLETLEELIDIKKMNFSHEDQSVLDIVLFNIKNSIFYKGNDTIRLYHVVLNKKSENYFKDANLQMVPFLNLEKNTLWVILNQDIGIVSSNSNNLIIDYKLNRGILQSDIDLKNNYLLDYLSAIENK